MVLVLLIMFSPFLNPRKSKCTLKPANRLSSGQVGPLEVSRLFLELIVPWFGKCEKLMGLELLIMSINTLYIKYDME